MNLFRTKEENKTKNQKPKTKNQKPKTIKIKIENLFLDTETSIHFIKIVQTRK